jgi:hypothetical protein
MPLVGFEPTIPASERPQTNVFNGATTGIGKITITQITNDYEKLTQIGRILFKLGSFTILLGSPILHPQQHKSIRYNIITNPYSCVFLLDAGCWLTPNGSSLPLKESQNVYGAALQRSVKHQTHHCIKLFQGS